MRRQNIRKLLLVISLLLFPVTLYYFSPALILNAGLNGIINGSFIIFALLLICSILFGRIFCSYICPAGGIQEISFLINTKPPKQKWRNYIKYGIWILWIGFVIYFYCKGGIVKIDFFYETENGISVSNKYAYIIYYGIILLIFLPSVIFGKRIFCHYFCWMAPFMVIGIKIRNILHIPGLHIISKKESCISCKRCNTVCPMTLNVEQMAQKNNFNNLECIQCGECIDICPQKTLKYGMKYKK
jgi:polyferredoxin